MKRREEEERRAPLLQSKQGQVWWAGLRAGAGSYVLIPCALTST
jgi:hypothetical protein